MCYRSSSNCLNRDQLPLELRNEPHIFKDPIHTKVSFEDYIPNTHNTNYSYICKTNLTRIILKIRHLFHVRDRMKRCTQIHYPGFYKILLPAYWRIFSRTSCGAHTRITRQTLIPKVAKLLAISTRDVSILRWLYS